MKINSNWFLLSVICVSLIGSSILISCSEKVADKPNIIFLLTDDQR